MKCPQCQHRNPAETLFCAKCGRSLHAPRQDRDRGTRTMHFPLQELPLGSTFAGRYQVFEELGQGGMGRVYKVLDREINEVVALKVLRPEISEQEAFIERFHNELKTARRISHKNVCGLYHLSKDADETYYITMEYVPGENLNALTHRVGRLTVGKAVFFAGQICEGLAEAHRLGVVHCDLKPQNIMIDQEGQVRIMDFGIARSLASTDGAEAGCVVGTPGYMSPEQLEGKTLDAATDVYALGVILYEMLTDQLPFEGESALALKHRAHQPKPPRRRNPEIPESLNRVILRCLEKHKERRYPSAGELLAELTRIEKSLRPTGETRLKKRKTAKIVPPVRFWSRWAAAALAVVVVGGGLWLAGKKLIPAGTAYENYVALELNASGPLGAQKDVIEYILLRTLSASTRWNIFVSDDVLTYKKRTASIDLPVRPAALSIKGDIRPKANGFDIALTLRHRNRTRQRTFDCKGLVDYLTEQIGRIAAFLETNSEGAIGAIENRRRTSQILTSSLDALEHYLKGEAAWKKLDSEPAFFEYRTAVENDPEFSLAHLQLADVLIFRSDRVEAHRHLDQALSRKERLIELDLLRLHALMARIEAKPAEERLYLGQLTEEFPFKKEYHYELGESYFHCGEAEEAIKHYQTALALDAGYSLAHNHIAYCYSWIGDHARALSHLRKYQTLDQTANACDSLASGLMFAGDYDLALSVLEEGVKISPNLDYLYGNIARNPWTHLAWAEVCLERGDRNKARAEYQAAADLLSRGDAASVFAADLNTLKRRLGSEP